MSWILSAFADEAAEKVEQQVQALHQAKITHVDLRGVDGKNITTVTPEHAQQVRKQLDAGKIRVGMFGSPIGKLDISDDFKIDLDRLNNLAKISDILGCKAVRVFSYYNKNNAPMSEWQKITLDRLRQLKELAAQHGMALYHENERHIFGDHIEQVLALADALHDGKSFKLIFDFDNFQQAGDNVWDNWLKLHSRIDAFHLKDSDKQNQHVPIGQGNGQAPEILADAVKRGWSGILTLEPHLNHSPAVLATGVSGGGNRTLKELGPATCFQIAADAAHALLKQVNAPLARG